MGRHPPHDMGKFQRWKEYRLQEGKSQAIAPSRQKLRLHRCQPAREICVVRLLQHADAFPAAKVDRAGADPSTAISEALGLVIARFRH